MHSPNSVTLETEIKKRTLSSKTKNNPNPKNHSFNKNLKITVHSDTQENNNINTKDHKKSIHNQMYSKDRNNKKKIKNKNTNLNKPNNSSPPNSINKIHPASSIKNHKNNIQLPYNKDSSNSPFSGIDPP